MRLKQDWGRGAEGGQWPALQLSPPLPERKLFSLLGEEGEGMIFALGRGENCLGRLVSGDRGKSPPSTPNSGRCRSSPREAPSQPCTSLPHATSFFKVPLQKQTLGWLAGCPSVGALFMCVCLGPAVFSAQQVTLAQASYLPRQSLLTYPWASGLVFIT